MKRLLPLVVPCHGCSAAARIADRLAARLAEQSIAEVGFLSGTHADEHALARAVKAGRPLVALDACELQCVTHLLARHGIVPDMRITLSNYGIERLDSRGAPERGDSLLEMLRSRLRALRS